MYLQFVSCFLLLLHGAAAQGTTDCEKGVDPQKSQGLTPDFDPASWPSMWRMISDEVIKDADSRQETNQLDPSDMVGAEVLAAAGVQYMFLDPGNYDYPEVQVPWEPNATGYDPLLADLRDERDFSYADIITVKARVDSFWTEHFHEFDTVRYIVNGTGYFDLRDANDEWVRFSVKTGDLFFWPGGIYHRFTVDTGNFITAMRLFQGSPIWSSFVRDDVNGNYNLTNHTSRIDYIDKYMCGDDPDAVTSDTPMKHFWNIKVGLTVLVIVSAMM